MKDRERKDKGKFGLRSEKVVNKERRKTGIMEAGRIHE